jgi:dephospho-CoA kinase
MSFVLGLTGSIGMGKTTTSAMFAARGLPVWDADQAVRDLYLPGQPGAQAVAALCPDCLQDGGVDRARLRASIRRNPALVDRLNAAIHPLTAASRSAFLLAHAAAPIVLLDIPLLYETGADAICDAVAVVSTTADLQRTRVLARGQMSAADLDLILARQLPDAEKRARATWVIDTTTLDSAARGVDHVLAAIRKDRPDA